MALDQNAKLFGHFMALRLVVQDMLKRQVIDADAFEVFLSETQAGVVADLHALDLKKGASKGGQEVEAHVETAIDQIFAPVRKMRD